ncbi:DedA family protein [archaeon]|nr:DedA family protein [archaeon]
MVFEQIFFNGIFNLFIISFLASTLLPLGSEGALAIYIAQQHNIWVIVLVATLGNYLGSFVNYYIGLKGRNTILHKIIRFSDNDIEKSRKLFNKYGSWVLFFSWVPIIGDPLTFVAGILNYDLKKFTFFVFFGKLFRYSFVALVVIGVIAM